MTDEQEREVARRYIAGELAHEIASDLGAGRKTISNALRRQRVQLRDRHEAMVRLNERRREKGERHPNFKGGRTKSTDGYMLVSLTEEDPLFVMASERGRLSSFGYGYVLEHRLVMARHLGRPLTQNETVHHKNGKRDDNRIENLELRVGNHGRGASHPHCPTCSCFD